MGYILFVISIAFLALVFWNGLFERTNAGTTMTIIAWITTIYAIAYIVWRI